jgi:hypothetical protein
MIKEILIIIIIYIIINQLILAFDDNNNVTINYNTSEKKIIKSSSNNNSNIDLNLFGKPAQYEENEFIHWICNPVNPWTQVTYKYNDEFPFSFFIKIKIPSLNDFQAWKNLLPNLNFDSKTGELIISTIDEATALAIANLIITNFQGHLTIDNIINKNLLSVSVNKAREFELIRNKLREQIMNTQHVAQNELKSDYEQDLAKKENFMETRNNLEKNIDAYEGGEYTYL